MQKNIFAYTAPGCSFPDFLSINQRDGRVIVSARGVNGPAIEGVKSVSTVDVELPREEVAKLVEGLLALPPVDAVKEAKPLVLYFETDADREECIAAFKEVKPNARAVRV